MTDDKLYSLSDEELERAFLDAKENEQYSDVDEPVTESIDTYEEEDIEIMEQPDEIDEDSVDEGATDDEVTTETESTEVTAQPDEEVATEDEDPIEEEKSEEDINDEIAQKEQQELVFKANGREFKFTQDEMLEQFPKIFGQAMDYTKKTQAMKPWRKTIDAIEQAKLGHEDINLMIDVMKGNKEAIAEVMKRTGVDSLEIDTENSKYTPNDYGRDDKALAIKDIVEEISVDKEYEITHRVLSKEWDEKSFREMTEDPDLIRLLHVDVKTGMFDKVQPIADKIKVFDRGSKSDLEYYRLASIELAQQQQEASRVAYEAEKQKQDRAARLAKQVEIDRVKKTQERQKEVAVKAVERKAATPTTRKVPTSKVVDYLDNSDEAFEEWYKTNVLDKI
jgi:hypothetical protein